MKKYFLLLVCCLAAAWSCKLEGSYNQSNVQDFVTLTEGQLVNDYGTVFTIRNVASDKVPVPTVEGKRYFLLFDILNVDLDITLKNSTEVTTLPVTPAEETAPPAHDPVSLAFYNITPSYLNLGLTYYRLKNSDLLHTFTVEYEKEKATNYITLILYHDGGDENPATVEDESALEEDYALLSIPLKQGDWTPSGVNLTCHVLQKNEEGAWEVTQTTY